MPNQAGNDIELCINRCFGSKALSTYAAERRQISKSQSELVRMMPCSQLRSRERSAQYSDKHKKETRLPLIHSH